MEPVKFEQSREAPVDKKAEAVKKQGDVLVPEISVSKSQSPAAPQSDEEAAMVLPQDKDEELLMIENILSEDILGAYAELSAAKKIIFKKRGEEAAFKIKILLKQAKVKVHEIFELIKNWLLTLPKINSYFLEQEAKIKTDKVMQFKKEGQEIER